jgi:uncharacterized protein YndB with AHSA1/START domain
VAIDEKIIAAPPQRVFDVLKDGWTYSDWVVGTVHVRDVDATWPRPGAQLHHQAGAWPLSLSDTSTVVSCEEPRQLTLCARIWPLGEATVAFTLTPAGRDATRVTIAEEFSAGPLRVMRNQVNDLLLHRRNSETLKRLSDIATRARAAR